MSEKKKPKESQAEEAFDSGADQPMLDWVLESIQEGVLVLDSAFRCTRWNTAMEAISHTPREAVLGTVPWERFAFLKGAVERAMQQAMRGEIPPPVELSYTLEDGTAGWTAERYFPLKDARDRIIGVVGLVEDISQRKQTETALRASERRFRELAEMLPCGVFECDANLKLTFANRKAFEYTGYSEEDFARGVSGLDMIVPADRVRAKQNMAKRLAGESVGNVEYTALRKDGVTFPLLLNMEPVHRAQKLLGYRGVLVDISERKRTEEALRKSEAQLNQARKMDAVGRLAGGVAHDFNNALCVISGNAEMALNTLRLGDPLREMIDEVAAAAARAGDLTRQLLAFSRKQIVEPKVVDLSVLLENMHSMLARLLGEDIDLQIHARRDIGCVRADPSHLEQVVLNLAINGRDAMPDGGKLVIETDAIVLDEDYCAVHPNAKEGPYVLLAVRDGGMGMDAETQEKIFEPFFTTKQQGQGTGLGLATVLGIVEQNGGRIDVISEAGQGTTFRVYFPRVAEDPKDAKEKERSTFAEGGETVLVVEDEKMVRNLAVRLLESCGYEVWAAASGPDALALAERRAGRVDLLLTDVVMPQMNGRQLADTLSKKYPQLKILYTSGYTDDVIAHHGLLDEGVRFIAKPYSRHALATKVRETLDDEPPSGRK